MRSIRRAHKRPLFKLANNVRKSKRLTAAQWFERLEEGHLDTGLETIAQFNKER
jgi:hypothetical protein